MLGINQMTISRRVKELERENVLDFRQEGKNKVYFVKGSIEAEEAVRIMEHIRMEQVDPAYGILTIHSPIQALR